MFSIENFKIISKFRPLQRMSHISKHVSKAGKVEPGDRVTLPVKIACKPDLLARVTPEHKVTLSPCKQALSNWNSAKEGNSKMFRKCIIYMLCTFHSVIH